MSAVSPSSTRRTSTSGAWDRPASAFALGLASLALHGAAVLMALALGSEVPAPAPLRRIQVEIEQRNPEPPPEPRVEPEPLPPEPPPPPPPRAVRKPPPAAPEPPPTPEPAEPEPSEPEPAAPEPAVPEPAAPEPPSVGLRPESFATTGDGPAFAAGYTLRGATGAVAPPLRPPAASRRGPVTAAPRGLAPRDVLPRRKRPVVPEYPPALERLGVEAAVMVSVRIESDGRVSSVRILKPARDEEFNEAARRAALSEQFEPARRAGQPVPYTLSFTYHFRLEER